MYKIAILYIALGKYDAFWSVFHETCESYFLRGLQKDYYVFTDSDRIQSALNVHVVSVVNRGWPRNTLDRFFFFDGISGDLQKSDYCFFFNANTCFLKEIQSHEILPDKEHEYLVNLSWHTNDGKKPFELRYDRNPLSTAYIEWGEGRKYYQGGLIGGRTKEFLIMKDYILKNISEDDQRGVVAISHDESHLNKYLVRKNPLCLGTYYGKPQEWDYPSDVAIVFRKKEDILGLFYIFRLKKKPVMYVLRHLLSRIKRKVLFK